MPASENPAARVRHLLGYLLGGGTRPPTHPWQRITQIPARAQAILRDRRSILRHSPDPVHAEWIHQCEPSHTQATTERFTQACTPPAPIDVLIIVGAEPLGHVRASLASARRQTRSPRRTRLVCTAACNGWRRLACHMLSAKHRRTSVCSTASWHAALQNGATWMVPLQPGDLLSARAVERYETVICNDTSCALLYGDEDRYDPASGARMNPVLKPGWAPVTLLTKNTVGHALCVRRTAARDALPQGKDTHPWSTHTLVLALARTGVTAQHLPAFLLHRRADAITHQADDAEITAHLHNVGIENVTWATTPDGNRRPSWTPVTWPAVTVVMIHDSPSRRRMQHGIEQLRAQTDYPDWTLVTYHDGRTSRAEALSRLAADARGTYICFVNPRVEPLETNWLRELVRWSYLPGVGAVGPLVLDGEGRVREAGYALGHDVLYGPLHTGASAGAPVPFGTVSTATEVSALSLTTLLVARDTLLAVDGFPARPQHQYLGISLCEHLRTHGYQVICAPSARVRQSVAVLTHSHADILPLANRLLERDQRTDPLLHPRLSVNAPAQVLPVNAPSAHDTVTAKLAAIQAACRPGEPTEPPAIEDPDAAADVAYPIRQLLEARWDLQFYFPLGTLPWGRAGLAEWLEQQAASVGITPEQRRAFLVDTAANPGRELALTWQRLPEWQRLHPDGLTTRGLPALLDWIAEVYGVPRDELESLDVPVDAPPAPRTDKDRPGVNLLGHLCLPCGVQQCALVCREALHRAGYAVATRDLPAAPTGDPPDRRDWLGTESYDISIYFVQPEFALEDWLARGSLYGRPGVYRIGNWYREFLEMPPHWIEYARDFEEIWAPSRFLEDAFRRHMEAPVVFMPPGLPMRFTRRDRSCFALPEDRFLFLFMFDMGSIMERKNPEALLEAFRQAVRPSDHATLVLKTSRGTQRPEALAALHRLADGLDVHFLDTTLDHGDVLALINCCDSYVSLHRSEGLGLPLAEAMLLGKPTIATNYSGNLDFMTADNSLLVEATSVALERDLGPYRAGWTWAEPDIDHAATLIRRVLDDRAAARDLGLRGQVDARQHFDMHAYAQRMADRLHAVTATP